MKRVLPALAAVGALAMALPAAAQTSADINARQAMLDARINQGLQDRTLTAPEAADLRAQFNDVANIEARYRDSDGLQPGELIDLDRRLGAIEGRIRVQRADAQVRPGFDNGAWRPINQRQAAIDQRIDQGIRNGALTAAEAQRLRADFRDIVVLEARYRATGGLQGWEQADLDHRLDQLNARVRIERADNQRAGQPWLAINLRQTMLDRRIDQGVRDGTLTRAESMRLRREFQQIAALEQRYRATGGLQGWERTDLDRRFDNLSAQIRVQRADSQTRDYRDRDRGGVGYNAGAR
jgi:hypothetical protein